MQIKQFEGHQKRPTVLYMLWVGLLIPSDEQLLVWVTLLRSNYLPEGAEGS